MEEILSLLKDNQDISYKEFNSKLVFSAYPMLGVRVPVLRKIAKQISLDNSKTAEFLDSKHNYFEEYFLHGLLLGAIKEDFNEKIKRLELFLPYIDNWQICDCTVSGLKIFKNSLLGLEKIKEWANSPDIFTRRFAVVLLLTYFLGNNYTNIALDIVKQVKTGDYYVDMAIAWLYSVALVKDFDITFKVIQSKTLTPFIQNKSIQKAVESFRITNENKNLLKKYKIIVKN